jgi:anion-transporting  ArsA/GET3 family ATPase
VKPEDIADLNDREPSIQDLPDLTDIEIGNLDTAQLRAWCEMAEVEDHYLFETVATLPLDDVMINTAGALPGLERYLTLLKAAYAARGPRVIKRYDVIEVRVWATDDMLRTRLQFVRDHARRVRDA